VTSLLVVVTLIRHIDGCLAMCKRGLNLLEGCDGDKLERWKEVKNQKSKQKEGPPDICCLDDNLVGQR